MFSTNSTDRSATLAEDGERLLGCVEGAIMALSRLAAPLGDPLAEAGHPGTQAAD